MAWTFEETERGYKNMWKAATLKGGADAANADIFADKIIAAEARYRTVQAATGVPWYFIGALHMRESSCNFAGILHNGEQIIGTGRVTTLEPDGRGPFATWQDAAIDALKLKDMHRVQEWSVARMLYQAEVFNGLGYVGKGVNSAYVWAGTNHEQRGKYVADHVWDGSFDDPQIGVAAVLIRLAEKRADIRADLYPEKTENPVDTQDDVIKEIQGLRADIAQLIAAIKGTLPPPVEVKPEPVKQPDPVLPYPTPQPAPSIAEKPGVGLGVLTLLLSGVLNVMGVTGPMTGEGATTTGQLLPMLAAGITGLGATGMFGSWGSAFSNVLGALVKPQIPPK